MNNLSINEIKKRDKDKAIVVAMARTLASDLARFERKAQAGYPKTVPQFREFRRMHDEIQGLIFSVEDRSAGIPDMLPDGFAGWVVRAKLRALTVFSELSDAFLSDPPIALTISIAARDALALERKIFVDAAAFFNKVLMEFGVDDKTAGELDKTLTLIEGILVKIDGLIARSAAPLPEF